MKNFSLCTIIFVCSLLANAFLVGFLLSGQCIHHGSHKRFDRMQEAAEDLGPAYRDKIQALLEKNHLKMDDHIKVMSHNFDKITAVLTAPKFDEAQLKAVHQNIEKEDNGMKDNMLSMVTSIAKILPDPERIKFFKAAAPDHPPGPGMVPGK